MAIHAAELVEREVVAAIWASHPTLADILAKGPSRNGGTPNQLRSTRGKKTGLDDDDDDDD
jgi:hypothetical protein